MSTPTLCSFAGCGVPAKAKGLCSGHWYQQRNGVPMRPVRRYASELDRLMSRIEKDPASGCWVWTGAKKRAGYGDCGTGNGSSLAHRRVYELVKGALPREMTLDHLCRNRACCNPDHLDPCDIGTNSRRGVSFNGSKTHCPKGHEYTPGNTRLRPPYPGTGRRHRYCRTCWTENHRRTEAA